MDGTLVDPSCSGLGARSPAGASRPTLTGGDLLGGAGVKLLRAAMNGVRRAPSEGIRCRYGAQVTSFREDLPYNSQGVGQYHLEL